MKILFSALIYFLLLLSCQGKEKNKETNPPSNKIVLIFKNPVRNNKYIFENGRNISNGSFHEISYINDQLIEEKLPLDYSAESDTIVIETKRSQVELDLCYKAIDRLVYFFKNGDTVLFTYQGGDPEAKVKNRKSLVYDINYSISVHKNIYKNEFPGNVKYDAFLFYDDILKFLKDSNVQKSIQESALHQFEIECHNELTYLDSLLQGNQISKENYRLYKRFLEFKYNNLLDIDKNKFDYNVISKQFNQRNDSLLFYQSYRNLLRRKAFNYFWPKPNYKNKSARKPDEQCFRDIYDSISLSKALTEQEKKVILYGIIERMIENSSKEDIDSYTKKFINTTKDTLMQTYFIKKYNLGSSTGDKLVLKDMNDKNLNFEDILGQNKGKFVYVDIWASWCAPCLASIPYSMQLINEFKNKNIVFIYLSLDENFKTWKNTAKRIGVVNNSYLITNKLSSKFAKEIKLAEIPRYLFYDTNGEMINQFAPDPKGKDVKDLFNKYLTK